MKSILYLPDDKKTIVEKGGVITIASNEWIVLDVDRKSKTALVLSKKELIQSVFYVHKPTTTSYMWKYRWQDDSEATTTTTYHYNYYCCSYDSDSCVIRPWIKESFYDQAFTIREQAFCGVPFLLDPHLFRAHKRLIMKSIDNPGGVWWLSRGERYKYLDKYSEKWEYEIGKQGFVDHGYIHTVDQRFADADDPTTVCPPSAHGVRPAMYVRLVAEGDESTIVLEEKVEPRGRRGTTKGRVVGSLALAMYASCVLFMVAAILLDIFADTELVGIAAPIIIFFPSLLTIIIAAAFFERKNVLNAIALLFVAGNIVYGPMLAVQLILD